MVVCLNFVCSDVHGYYGRFRMLLKEIEFSDNDTMYILGDVIDRGSQGIKMLQHVMKSPNIHMIMGNHEDMMISYINKDKRYCSPYSENYMLQLWYQNGGMHTQENFMNLCPEERDAIAKFLSKLPHELNINVGGKDFRLVHGFPANRKDFKNDEDYHNSILWDRPERDESFNIPENQTVILGHTPTAFYGNKFPMEILEIAPHVINIDCGMAGGHKTKRIGCVRLEDMKVFYK